MDKYHEDIDKARPFEKKCVEELKKFHGKFSGFSHIDDLKINWQSAYGDAYDPSRREWMEIKADNYKPTGNLFIERYSNLQDKIDGGPWQYSKCKYYVYYFVNQDRIIIMNTLKLKNYVEKAIQEKSCRESTISRAKTGRDWETFGYLVKEEVLSKNIPWKEILIDKETQ